MPLGHDSVCSTETDPISYVDIWVPVYRLLGLGQVWFPSEVVALTYLCPQLRHWNSSLPPAQQSMCLSLGWRHHCIFQPLQSLDIKKHHSFM